MMNAIIVANMDVHPLIAGRINGTIRAMVNGKIDNDPLYPCASWVIAFCYGENWCFLLRKKQFQRFFDSDVALPIRHYYLHSIAVPEVLDSFCEELITYQDRSMCDIKKYTLSLAHLSLQVVNIRLNSSSIDGRTRIRRVLIRLSIFYHLMYVNMQMKEWAGWISTKTEEEGYIWIWNQSEWYDGSAKIVHATMEPLEQYTDQHLWVEWVEPRISTTDSDVSVRILSARTTLFPKDVNE
jgi:hypothetical protein